jgi:hypothetical protein
MSTIEKQTLEEQRERWKRAIDAEKLAIAGGNLSLDNFVAGDPDLVLSRREHLLELQSRLAEVESRLASEEMSA